MMTAKSLLFQTAVCRCFKMCSKSISSGGDFVENFLAIENKLSQDLSHLTFNGKVAFVYNPLEYAKETHQDYINKYCTGPKTLLFLGMNPGPFGMVQNGVPFGDTHYVKDWLQIEGNVKKPAKEHSVKTIEGLDCKRSEVSGSRLWSLFSDVSETPDVFFKQCFVHNYCPLAFLSKTGKNVTPPELAVSTRNTLTRVCNKTLAEVIELLGVKFVVGVGKFSEQKVKEVLKVHDLRNVKVFGIMHPSPINPAANKGWKEIVRKQLIDAHLIDYLR